MKVKPLRDNVLISSEKEEKSKTDSGIFLPETAKSGKERPQVGKVIEIGDSEKIKVEVGQRVIFSKYAGTEIEVEGSSYLIIKNEDILAIIEK